jgi:hypothetical protein
VTATCPWCSAPRVSGATCPRCGALYAKAEQIKTQGRATPAAAAVPPVPGAGAAIPVRAESPLPAQALAGLPAIGTLDGLPSVEDPVLEWKYCVGALPGALFLGIAFHFLAPFLQRTFLGMPVHELGHAVTAWLCGHFAVPIVWKTFTAETRGFVAPVGLLAAIGFMMYRAHLAENRALLALGGALLLVQAAGTLFIRPKTAEMLIVFGGDGLGMILATALMASFFFGKDTQLYKGSLRWGFLAIGAAAFVDMFAVWWAARGDFGAIPFGEMEGVGLSDATRLVDDFGWTAEAMVRRYVGLGACCLAALALVYAWGVRQARQRIGENDL